MFRSRTKNEIGNNKRRDMNQNPMDVFQKESPAVAKAFDGLIDSLRATTGLNDKMKQLIYIGLQASLGNSTAIYYHVPMAKKAGATRDEVKDAILITLTICGLKGVTTCLPVALEVYDKSN
jgi:alkylhydroperoxidase/carboxymuconolactone decarboxylase family protein YurZ